MVITALVARRPLDRRRTPARGGQSEIVLVDAAIRASARRSRPPDERECLAGLDAGRRAGLFRRRAIRCDGFEIYSRRRRNRRAVAARDTGPSARSRRRSGADGTLVYVGYTPRWLRSVSSMPLEFVRTWSSGRKSRRRRPDAAERTAPIRRAIESASVLAVARRSRPASGRRRSNPMAARLVVGAATGGYDALGRHAYAVDAGWSRRRARPDWQVAYAYDRWRPTLFAEFSDDTDPLRDGEVRTTRS